MTNANERFNFYEIFEGSPWESDLLKSILEDHDIESIIQQSSSLLKNIWPTNAVSMKVFVASKDLESAKIIVAEFITNISKKINTPE